MTTLAAQSLDTAENPIRVIRKSLGLSLRDAAEKIGCHHQALYMNERGCNQGVLPVVLDWLVGNSEHDQNSIEMAYSLFVRAERIRAAEKYDFASATIADLGLPGWNPIDTFHTRFKLSRSAFCKTVCLSASLLYTLENTSAQHLAVHIPASVLDVFREIGVDEGVIQEMIERYEVWRDGL